MKKTVRRDPATKRRAARRAVRALQTKVTGLDARIALLEQRLEELSTLKQRVEELSTLKQRVEDLEYFRDNAQAFMAIQDVQNS